MIVKLLEKIPQTWQSLAALTAAALLGWAAHTVVMTQIGLPDVVTDNSAMLQEHTVQIGELRRKLDQMICLQIASRIDRPFQECIR